jgi:hypothetical protein
MKHSFLATIAASGLLLFAVSAVAQDRDRDDDRRRDESRHARMFQQVRDDVSKVQEETPYFSSDQFRLVRVKEELGELQDKYDRHGYDGEALDDVIHALDRVVSDNHLAGRERDMLNDDLNRLKEFREHHEGYR